MFRDGKASAIEKFLPVYDNLSRALGAGNRRRRL